MCFDCFWEKHMPYFGTLDFPLYNPWWETPEAIKSDLKIQEFEAQKFPYRHPLLETFPTQLDAILTLRGPRRIGKTTLVKLIIKNLLLHSKIPPENVFFYSCDQIADFKELSIILQEYLSFIRPRTKERIFIFLDEISFVREWQRTIKMLVDTGQLQNATCLLTGSSTIDLTFSSERLPGRRGVFPRPDIDLLPLTFGEFGRLVKPELVPKTDPSFHLASFQKLFDDYLLTGGFPHTINEYYQRGFISSTTFETFIKWIEGDLHKVGKSEKLATQILNRIFVHLTSPISWYKLAKESGIGSHATVMDYVEILKRLFVLFDTECFLIEQRQVDIKKNRKVYFTDPFIFNCLSAYINGFLDEAFTFTTKETITAETKPGLVENTVASHLSRVFSPLYYGKTKEGEIDFVGKRKDRFHFFEVKYQSKVSPSDFLWTDDVIPGLTVITKTDRHQDRVNLIPVEIFLRTLLS